MILNGSLPIKQPFGGLLIQGWHYWSLRSGQDKLWYKARCSDMRLEATHLMQCWISPSFGSRPVVRKYIHITTYMISLYLYYIYHIGYGTYKSDMVSYLYYIYKVWYFLISWYGTWYLILESKTLRPSIGCFHFIRSTFALEQVQRRLDGVCAWLCHVAAPASELSMAMSEFPMIFHMYLFYKHSELATICQGFNVYKYIHNILYIYYNVYYCALAENIEWIPRPTRGCRANWHFKLFRSSISTNIEFKQLKAYWNHSKPLWFLVKPRHSWHPRWWSLSIQSQQRPPKDGSASTASMDVTYPTAIPYIIIYPIYYP